MVNPISLPSWREDQPSAAETAIANTLASRNMALGGTLLNEYAGQRAEAQQGYHDYLAGVNDLQRRNLALGQQENIAKLIGDAGSHPMPGQLAVIRQMFPGMIPENPELDQSISSAANAANFEKGGRGAGAFIMAGGQMDPGSLSRLLPGATGVGQAPIVQAQGVANQGRIGAAQINAAGRQASAGKVTTRINGPMGGDIMGPSFSVSGTDPTAVQRAWDQAQGGGGAANAPPPSLPAAKTDTPHGAPSGGASAPSKDQVNSVLMRLRQSNPGAYADIVAGQQANGGQLKFARDSAGRVGIVGGKPGPSGQPTFYAVQ